MLSTLVRASHGVLLLLCLRGITYEVIQDQWLKKPSAKPFVVLLQKDAYKTGERYPSLALRVRTNAAELKRAELRSQRKRFAVRMLQE